MLRFPRCPALFCAAWLVLTLAQPGGAQQCIVQSVGISSDGLVWRLDPAATGAFDPGTGLQGFRCWYAPPSGIRNPRPIIVSVLWRSDDGAQGEPLEPGDLESDAEVVLVSDDHWALATIVGDGVEQVQPLREAAMDLLTWAEGEAARERRGGRRAGAPTTDPSSRGHPGTPPAAPPPADRSFTLRFFESDGSSPPTDDGFAAVFPQATTRYVNWHLTVVDPRPTRELEAFDITAEWAVSNGVTLAVQTTRAVRTTGTAESWHYMAWGWTQPGQWPVGAYTVRLEVGGSTVTTGGFLVR